MILQLNKVGERNNNANIEEREVANGVITQGTRERDVIIKTITTSETPK
jgi:hypothetical protein